jgi:site-specific recombinase XerD
MKLKRYNKGLEEDKESYLQELRDETLSDNYINQHRGFLNGIIKANCISDDDIIKYIKRKHNNNPARVFLRKFLKHRGWSYDDIKDNVGSLKKKETIIHHFTPLEIKRIFANLKGRVLIICMLMFENGLRISEVMGIMKQDIDLVNRKIKVIGKGGDAFVINITTRVYNLLIKYLKLFDKEDYVFHWTNLKGQSFKGQRQKAYKVIKRKVLKILTNKSKEEVYPHAFRHSFGTHLMNKGLNLREVQKLLRHKQLETTAKYTAVVDKNLTDKWRNAMEDY